MPLGCLCSSDLGRWLRQLESLCSECDTCPSLLRARATRLCRGELLVNAESVEPRAPSILVSADRMLGKAPVPNRARFPCNLMRPSLRPSVTCLIGNPPTPLITVRSPFRNLLRSFGTAGTSIGCMSGLKVIPLVPGQKLSETHSRLASRPLSWVRVCRLPLTNAFTSCMLVVLLPGLRTSVPITPARVRFSCRGQTMTLMPIGKSCPPLLKLRPTDIIWLTLTLRNLIGVPIPSLCNVRLKCRSRHRGPLPGGVRVAIRLLNSLKAPLLAVGRLPGSHLGVWNVMLLISSDDNDLAPIVKLPVLTPRLTLSVP